jgi:hypothetical protein
MIPEEKIKEYLKNSGAITGLLPQQYNILASDLSKLIDGELIADCWL